MLCLADLYTISKLNGWEPGQVSGAELTVGDFDALEDIDLEMHAKVARTPDRKCIPRFSLDWNCSTSTSGLSWH